MLLFFAVGGVEVVDGLVVLRGLLVFQVRDVRLMLFNLSLMLLLEPLHGSCDPASIAPLQLLN
jgi:hypothetical protein